MKERGISINDFLKSKEIKMQEVKDNFHFVKRLDVDMTRYKCEESGCLNCGNKANSYGEKSEPWTGAIYCAKCESLMFIYFSDRMGGNHTDTVDIYEQKNRPQYRIIFHGGDICKEFIECRICGCNSYDESDVKNKFCQNCNKTLE
jgi:hypothetical protein